MTDAVWSARHGAWAELTPLVRRVVRADDDALVRLRRTGTRIGAFAHLPSQALVARTVLLPDRSGDRAAEVDVAADTLTDTTFLGAQLLDWLDGNRADPPHPADARWLGPLPPVTGWRRVDVIPDAVVRDVVRQGALAHVDAANLGLGARAAENLLDTPVLTVTGDGEVVRLTNRTLSALTAMGFLPRDGEVVVAIAERWTRVAAPHGSVFAADRGGGLSLA